AFFSFMYFVFSSRRRHTRFSRDWSSDVCSSDLALAAEANASKEVAIAARHAARTQLLCQESLPSWWQGHDREGLVVQQANTLQRSEERRVGKECRSSRGPCE